MIVLKEIETLTDETRKIAVSIHRADGWGVHSARAITVPPVINDLEERKEPYTLVAVPGQGYVIVDGDLISNIQKKIELIKVALLTLKDTSPEYYEEVGKKKMLLEFLQFFQESYRGTKD